MSQTVLISGASGLIGQELTKVLEEASYTVVPLKRSGVGTATWDSERGIIELDKNLKIDSVIHLAGENIAAGRWSKKRKQEIYNSRIVGTKALVDALLERPVRPSTFICASAIGYYGDAGSTELDESSPVGKGFLAELCRDWEAVSSPLNNAEVRVINLRTGVVLSRRGGALAKMLPVFKLGLGGVLGSGRQYLSWITLSDLIRVIQFALENPKLSGPLNCVAPIPVTNREFTKALGKQLHRPTVFPVPAWLLRLVLGEMADELLLSSARVVPKKLIEAGFQFDQTTITDALGSPSSF